MTKCYDTNNNAQIDKLQLFKTNKLTADRFRGNILHIICSDQYVIYVDRDDGGFSSVETLKDMDPSLAGEIRFFSALHSAFYTIDGRIGVIRKMLS